MGDSKYILSDTNYYYLMHSICIFAFPIYIFGTFIILTKTPSKILSMRLPLFMYHFFGISSDITLSILTIPVVIFPSYSGYTLGIMNNLFVNTVIQCYANLSIIAASGVAIMAFYENRHHHLVHRGMSTKRSEYFRLSHIIFNYLLCLFFPLPAFYKIPDDRFAIEYVKEKVPFISDEIINKPGYLVLATDIRPLFFSAFLLLIFVFLQGLYFGISSVRSLSQTNQFISHNTMVLQRQIFAAIALQSTIPLVFFVVPLLYIIYSVNLEYYNQVVEDSQLKHGATWSRPDYGGSYEAQFGCKPYSLAPCSETVNNVTWPDCPEGGYDTPTCVNSCTNKNYSIKFKKDKYYGLSAYAVGKKVAQIQTEIYNNGPVEATFTVYEDFYQYTSGIYSHTAGDALGGHAVKIIGWGVEKGTPYWLIANSWNANWGEQGYFRMLRGTNECGIEEGVTGGIPKV